MSKQKHVATPTGGQMLKGQAWCLSEKIRYQSNVVNASNIGREGDHDQGYKPQGSML